jgi:hypothetical protein
LGLLQVQLLLNVTHPLVLLGESQLRVMLLLIVGETSIKESKLMFKKSLIVSFLLSLGLFAGSLTAAGLGVPSVQAGSAGNATHSDVNVQYGRKK